MTGTTLGSPARVDGFTLFPVWFALGGAGLFVLVTVSEEWLPLPDFWLLLILVGAPAVLLATGLVHLLRWRLRQVALSGLGIAVFLALAYPLVGFQDDIHFFLLKPFYLAQVASSKRDGEGPRSIDWYWDSGPNLDISLAYDDRWNTQSFPKTDDDGFCRTNRRFLGGHFVLMHMGCYK